MTAGSAAMAAQIRKHRVNDGRCSELGWVCIPLVVETYGCWGTEAIQALSRLATRLSTRQGLPKSLTIYIFDQFFQFSRNFLQFSNNSNFLILTKFMQFSQFWHRAS